MKLKRLFWASLPLFFLFSCASNKSAFFQKESAVEKNIYSQYMTIADEYFSQKKYDKAEIYYKECIKFSEYKNAATYKLAKTYVFEKKYESAIGLYETLLLEDSKNQTLIENLAYCYAMSGQKDRAEELYLSLINDYSNQSSYFENLIIIYIQDKKIEQSKIYLELLKQKFSDCSNIKKFENEIKKLEEENH